MTRSQEERANEERRPGKIGKIIGASGRTPCYLRKRKKANSPKKKLPPFMKHEKCLAKCAVQWVRSFSGSEQKSRQGKWANCLPSSSAGVEREGAGIIDSGGQITFNRERLLGPGREGIGVTPKYQGYWAFIITVLVNSNDGQKDLLLFGFITPHMRYRPVRKKE